MKIIGKLKHSANSLSQAHGSLTYPNLDSFVVCSNEHSGYTIYEMMPKRDSFNTLYVEYHQRVVANTLELLEEWIGSQYKIELI